MEVLQLVNIFLLFGALIVLIGILSSLIATRFGIPLLVVFLAIGMLVGEDGLGVDFENYQLTYLIGSLALAIILFDGGLRTRISAGIRRRRAAAGLLATIGVIVTAAVVGVAARYALDLSWLEGFLLGAVVGSTDAAAVFFLLRTGGLNLKRHVASTLELESATNDPAAVLLTLIATSALLSTDGELGWQIPLSIVQQVGLGVLFGTSGGYAISWAANKLPFPAGLHPLMVAASAVMLYALTAVAGGSGFLAVFLAGLVVGNRPTRGFSDIIAFHDAATWLSQMVMFIVLGLLVTPTELVRYVGPALIIGLVLTLIARPIAVWLCLMPFRYSNRETAFVSWVGLRGAVSIFLAAIPTLAQIEHAEIYFNVAFVVVLVSLLVQGSTIRGAALWLGLATRERSSPPQRIELDVPGRVDIEIVGYEIMNGSRILLGAAVPAWARLIVVIRDRDVMTAEKAGSLTAGDYAYFLAPPKEIQAMDTLFAVPEEPEGARDV